MKIRLLLFLSIASCFIRMHSQDIRKINGEVIGSELAFDGSLDTYFASYSRSMAFCGLKLDKPVIVTRVGCSPRNDSKGAERVLLGVFEGANQADFSDAVQLFVVKEKGKIGEMTYFDVNTKCPFKYLRYVGPDDSRCNVAEVEFWGRDATASEMSAVRWSKDFYRPASLPVVSIQIPNSCEPQDKENMLTCTVTFIPSVPEDSVITEHGQIRLRGNESMKFPKKPYRLKLNQKRKIFGAPSKAKKWNLINNYGDKSLMRNMLAFDFSKRLEMEWTPWCQPVDVFMNGEYKGCYQLCEQVEVGNGRLEADCLLEIDGYADRESNSFFYFNNDFPVTIKFPDEEDLDETDKYDLENAFNAIENRVLNYDTDWRNYLDETSFLKFFLIGEFTGNSDTFWSMNMYRKANDEKFYVGPVWDFDLAYENDSETYPICQDKDWLFFERGVSAGNARDLASCILYGDSLARINLMSIWYDLRINKGMNKDTLINVVNRYADLLDESQKLNFTRWKILDVPVHRNWDTYGTYAEKVGIIREYISQRMDWMDEKLNLQGILDSGIVHDSPDRFINVQSYNLMGQKLPRQDCGFFIKAKNKYITSPR